MRENGSFQIKGRTTDGLRFKVLEDVVYPGPIEAVVARYPGVDEVLVS